MKDLSKTYYYKGFKLRGWFNSDKKEWYYNLIKDIKNGEIVEIGVYGGASILHIAEYCKKNNTNITGIDPWELIYLYNEKKLPETELDSYRKMMKEHRTNLEMILTAEDLSNVSLNQGFSLEEVLSYDDKSVDLVYIDANHSYEEVYKDIIAWFPKVKEGGVLCGDDYAWAGVERAVKQFTSENDLTFTNTKDSWAIQK